MARRDSSRRTGPARARRGAGDPLPPEVLADVTDLLAACPALAGIDRTVLTGLTRDAEIAHLAGAVGPLTPALVVMRGGVYVRDAQGRAVDAAETGELVVVDDDETVDPAEPTLVVWLPARARDLAWSVPLEHRPAPLRAPDVAAPLQVSAVRRVMRSPVEVVDGATSCRDVARRLRDLGISSVLVRIGGDLGIATDRDLRTRLVAEGRSPDTPVREIATVPVRTIDAGATAFEGLLEMLGSGVHHLPVAEGERIVGMLSSGDLTQLGSRSPLGVRVALDRAQDAREVGAAVALLPATVAALLDAGTRPEAVSRVVATMTDRVQARVLDLALADASAGLGGPPSDFGWLAFGSQARREQTLHTDQDTGLLLPDGLDEAALAWWARLADRVVEDLETAGYPRCHGGVMASSPEWRLDLTGWRRRIEGLVHQPSEHHLLESAIVFDLRTVAGGLHAGRLLGPGIAGAAGQQTFLGRLARVAIGHRPPLGFLGRLAVQRAGSHEGRFDVKAGAMLPIVDLARLTALARGGTEVGTADRLRAAGEDSAMSVDLAATLTAGYELATGLRLRHHVEQLARGEAPDNWLDPTALAPHERSQLRETFKGVRTAQETLASRYRTSLLA